MSIDETLEKYLDEGSIRKDLGLEAGHLSNQVDAEENHPLRQQVIYLQKMLRKPSFDRVDMAHKIAEFLDTAAENKFNSLAKIQMSRLSGFLKVFPNQY